MSKRVAVNAQQQITEKQIQNIFFSSWKYDPMQSRHLSDCSADRGCYTPYVLKTDIPLYLAESLLWMECRKLKHTDLLPAFM
jgi:hypothetical protein